MKTKYLMCSKPKKYRVRLFSSRVLGGYSSKFTVYMLQVVEKLS